jgi:uncharacterized protein (TIGR03437 family)
MKKGLFLLALANVAAVAFPTGAPPGRTGAPGETTCVACHRTFPLNPEGGRIRIEAVNYKPGQAQTVRITIGHTEATRWGFEITARWAKDPSQNAGTFAAPSEDVQLLDGGYVTHTLAGTRTNGANGEKSFEVQWTPPTGMEDSDIIFYAAGNAANGNASGAPPAGNTGDRIYATQTRIQADVACGFTERPVITGVVDGASFNKAVSARAIVTLTGRNFAAANMRRDAKQGYLRDNNFPKELGCMAVDIGGQRAPILYANENQINVQVPALSALGDVPVRVIMNPDRPNSVTSEPINVTLQAASPAFFTFNGTSVASREPQTGLTIAQSAVVPGARPAKPGEDIELYVTGLGPTQTDVPPGALAPGQAISTTQKPTVTIGNTTLSDADVLYSGLAPGNISGLYQINIKVPASASNGDLPIRLSQGGMQSVAGTTIPVQAQ